MGNLDNKKSIEEHVSLYFDNALSSEDQHQLFNTLDNDPQSCEIFEKEKQAREFLKTNYRKSCVTTDFIESIKKQINLEH